MVLGDLLHAPSGTTSSTDPPRVVISRKVEYVVITVSAGTGGMHCCDCCQRRATWGADNTPGLPAADLFDLKVQELRAALEPITELRDTLTGARADLAPLLGALREELDREHQLPVLPELDMTKNELIHDMGTDLPDAPQSDTGRQLPADLGLGMTKNELINNMGTDLPDVLQSNAKRKLPSDLEDLGVDSNELINNMGADVPGVPQSNVERPLPMDSGPGMTKNELSNNLGTALPDILQPSMERQLPMDSGPRGDQE